MKRTLLLLSCSIGLGLAGLQAQCSFRTTALASGDTLHCSGGDIYRSAVAYNPVDNLYYSVNAGGTTPEETFDAAGNLLSSSVVADWRGLWWNPNTSQIEGNAWGEYFFVDSLLPNGYLGGGHLLVASVTPPHVQAPGAYDAAGNVIYYYYNSTLYGESRADFTDITPVTLTGIPSFAGIIDPAVIYVDCPGSEIGLFDAGTNTLYLFNKSTGARTASVQFPTTALPISYNMGNFSYANEKVWLYNYNSNIWVGYDIFAGPASVDAAQEMALDVYPNPAHNSLNVSVQEPTEVSILNLLGEVLQTVQVERDMPLDIGHLSNGVYLLKSGNGATRKFIKE